MTQDDRMRELVDRMGSMTPETPSFPADGSVSPAPSRRRPVLAFAGVALAVLAVAAVPLFLSLGGEDPVPGATTTPAPVTTVPATPTTAATDQPGTTVAPVAAASPESIFVTQQPEASLTGNPALVPIRLMGPAVPDDRAQEVFYALGALTHFEVDLPSALDVPGFPGGVEVLDVEVSEDSATTLIVNLNAAFLEGAGGLLADFTMLNQLIYTATYLDEFNEVIFLAEGQPVTQFGSEGLDLTGVLSRDSFQTELAPIYLTEPAVVEGDTIRVAGMANTFEANVVIQLLGADEELLHEDFTTASCGTGCWGSFETFVADETAAQAVWVRLLEYSARDGSPQNVITVPVQRADGDFVLFG